MCFSAKASAGFAAMGAATTLLLLMRGRSAKYVGLVAYFTLMELLQLGQYMVIDQCDSKVNQLLTLLAYLHVALQPVAFNLFVWGLPQPVFAKPITGTWQGDRIARGIVLRLAAAASGALAIKALPAFLQLFSVSRGALEGLVGSAAASYLLGGSCGAEMLCGAQGLCAFQGKHHVAWSVPALPAGAYVPSAFLHTFFFFAPAIFAGGPAQVVLGLAALATGPLLTEWVIGADATARKFEWATIWCMFSVGQVLLLLLVELVGSRALAGFFHLPANTPAAEMREVHAAKAAGKLKPGLVVEVDATPAATPTRRSARARALAAAAAAN